MHPQGQSTTNGCYELAKRVCICSTSLGDPQPCVLSENARIALGIYGKGAIIPF